jgi:hypothetical protein
MRQASVGRGVADTQRLRQKSTRVHQFLDLGGDLLLSQYGPRQALRVGAKSLAFQLSFAVRDAFFPQRCQPTG